MRALTVLANQLIVGSGTTWNQGTVVGRWTGTAWQSLDSDCWSDPYSGSPDWVRALGVHDGRLVAGGSFTAWGTGCNGQWGWGLFHWDDGPGHWQDFSGYIP